MNLSFLASVVAGVTAAYGVYLLSTGSNISGSMLVGCALFNTILAIVHGIRASRT